MSGRSRQAHAEPAPRVLYVAEPPPAWDLRPPVVVDCSVVAAVLWAEPAAAQAQARLAGRSWNAPALLGCELANVARNKCRSGVPDAVARAGLEAFAAQRIVLHESPVEALFDLAQQYGLTAYDAAYLQLALTLKAPLITFDRKLGEAAARALGRAPGDLDTP